MKVLMLLIFEVITLTTCTDGWMVDQYFDIFPNPPCRSATRDKTCSQITNLLQNFVVEFEGPELQAGGQGIDGGQGQQELLGCSQRDVRIGQLSLLDLQLLLL